MTGATRRPTPELLAMIDKLVNDAMTGPPDMKLLPYISALSEAAVCMRSLGTVEAEGEGLREQFEEWAQSSGFWPGYTFERDSEGYLARTLKLAEAAWLAAQPANGPSADRTGLREVRDYIERSISEDRMRNDMLAHIDFAITNPGSTTR